MAKQPKCSIKTCDKPAASGKKMCNEHRKIYADRAAARREKCKESGTCITPGCNQTRGLSAGGRCKKCREKNAAGAKVAAQTRMDAGLCRNAHAGKPRPAKEGCTLCQECIDNLSANSSAHYHRRKEEGLCRFCNKPPEVDGGSLCAYHRTKYAEYRFQVKLEAFEHYGNAECAKCGCDNLDILEIDHVGGGGGKHRRELNMEGGGYQFYLWLKREGYPKGFQVLCPSCNRQAHVDTINKSRK